MSSKTWINLLCTVLLVLTSLVDGFNVRDIDCGCESLEIVSTKPEVNQKHSALLGSYRLKPAPLHDRPVYEHYSGKFFLYYAPQSQGFWAVGEKPNTEVVRLENQGDALCPYRLKSTWRFADGDLKALVYDDTLKVVCLEDACSVANCGHQAYCTKTGNNTVCECKPDFFGNPYERCYPEENGQSQSGCACQRLIFSSQNSVALSKHSNSYGEYFLYDYYQGYPVYQHFAGVEYLYKRDGNWLISDKVGLREAGLQNQGEDSSQCPYHFRTTWEYADIEQPGWQWVYDFTARMVCPTDICSITKCGFNANCVEENGQGICKCESGYSGNAYRRCFPDLDKELEALECQCKEVILSSIGDSALAQADKMGSYFIHSMFNDRPAYQHRSGLDYLYYADGNAWVVGAKFGGSRVGIVNFDKSYCPYSLRKLWKHSVSGELRIDESLTLECNEFYEVIQNSSSSSVNSTLANKTPDETKVSFEPSPLEPKSTTTTKYPSISTHIPTLSTTTSLSISTHITKKTHFTNASPTIQTKIAKIVPITTASPKTTTSSFASTTTSSSSTTSSTLFPTFRASTTTITTTRKPANPFSEPSSNVRTACPCKEIVVTSNHTATVEKHGSQLGVYELHGERAGRPLYKHRDREQFLYYHSYSGGNWLINNEVGLLYGGIQNSKDLPICPYLINTVWQYGDSELGGWVYDKELKVTCPTDACSTLKCGFRAICMQDDSGQAHCLCRQGFRGDPRVRCFPIDIQQNCPCNHVELVSTGPAKEHQRDKMGDYYLWGYYNNHPVYQHYSGLDFIYFHKNNVWGIGPKIGGNSAGLLNFGRTSCPYLLITPWEFGTKDKTLRRQTDTSVSLTCRSPENNNRPKPFVPHVPPKIAKEPSIAKTTINTPELQTIVGREPLKNNLQGLTKKLENQFQLKPKKNHCGQRIVHPDPYKMNGPQVDKTVEYGAVPWQANIALMQENKRIQHICSGAVVDELFVLTAASCLTRQPMMKFRVLLSDHNIAKRDFFEAMFGIQAIYIHDNYNEGTGENDLALVKIKPLSGNVPPTFNKHLQSVCLPDGRGRMNPVCELSTWISNSQPVLSAQTVSIVGPPRCPTDSLCAGVMDHPLECNALKGTPLVCSSAEKSTLYGILTKPPNCTVTANPATNTFLDLRQYSAWISKLVETL